MWFIDSYYSTICIHYRIVCYSLYQIAHTKLCTYAATLCTYAATLSTHAATLCAYVCTMNDSGSQLLLLTNVARSSRSLVIIQALLRYM